jgi:hypothetical protein
MKDYYWEEELEKLLNDFLQEDYYGSSADIILFVKKLIDAEKENAINKTKTSESNSEKTI